MPRKAEHELEIAHDPMRLSRVMELRAYAQSYHAIRNAKREEDIPKGKMTDLVADIEIELMTERQG